MAEIIPATQTKAGSRAGVQTKAFAATSAEAELSPFSINRRDPGPSDVVIDILYCGVCHSDLHQARNEWHNTTYPVVPGHEIVGRVTAVGPDVTKYKTGDLVGVVCFFYSCRTCEKNTKEHKQNKENKKNNTYIGVDRVDGQITYGGYS